MSDFIPPIGKELAIDIEHHDFRSYRGFVCLLQLSTRATLQVTASLRVGRGCVVRDEAANVFLALGPVLGRPSFATRDCSPEPLSAMLAVTSVIPALAALQRAATRLSFLCG